MLNGGARAFFIDCATRSSSRQEIGYSSNLCHPLYGLPPNKSSFSRPIGFLNDMSSPVPIAPCFPFRKTSAREVEGRRPFSSSRLECLATSWRLPRVIISVCLGRVAGGRGGGFAALAFKFLGGMSLRRRKRCETETSADRVSHHCTACDVPNTALTD
jgi:hypothetical protein